MDGDGRSRDGRRGGRPRVLLIAEAANPEWTSVPLVGWSHGRALASVADVHMVTQVRNREAMIRAGLREGEDFTAIDSEAVAKPIWRLGTLLRGGKGKGWTMTTALGAISYAYFERLVWREFGARIRGGEYDVVHRLTPLSPTTPSLLAKRCRRAGVPFVLGPLNGGVPWPRGFNTARVKEREWLSYVRGLHRLTPWYGSTRRDARAIIVASRDTLAQFEGKYGARCVYIPENGIDPSRFGRARQPRGAGSAGPLRAIFVGRLVPYKGPDMLVEAAAPLVREGAVTLEFVGDGPLMPELKRMIAAERIGAGVTFHGWVAHERVQEKLVEADVFAFPSIREFGGGAVLEAMAVGLAPMVVGYGGPAELVTEGTGWAAPIGDRASIVARFREMLAEAAADRGLVEARAAAALERARRLFTWDAKARQTLEVYRWVMGERDEKPDWGMPLRDPAPGVGAAAEAALVGGSGGGGGVRDVE